MEELRKMERLAMEAARCAGEIIREFHGKKVDTQSKASVQDLVTEYDSRCEVLILDRISTAYPSHKLVGEESWDKDTGFDFKKDEIYWIVDPIDGTTNFVHGYPSPTVSIGVTKGTERLVGVVYNPITDEMYSAVKGGGAFMNGVALKVSSETMLNQALVVIEYGSSRDPVVVEDQLHKVRGLLLKGQVQGVRTAGGCALNICNVASGRSDAYFEGLSIEFGPKPWDMSAALVILEEAGGVCFDVNGSSLDFTSGRVLVAGTEALAKQLIDVIA